MLLTAAQQDVAPVVLEASPAIAAYRIAAAILGMVGARDEKALATCWLNWWLAEAVLLGSTQDCRALAHLGSRSNVEKEGF